MLDEAEPKADDAFDRSVPVLPGGLHRGHHAGNNLTHVADLETHPLQRHGGHLDQFAVELAAEAPRQIANAHTIFNVANTFIFIWFTTLLARLVEWMIPDRPLDEESVISAKYLDADVLSTPSIALDLVRREIRHMGEQVLEMIAGIMPAILHGSVDALDEIRAIDERVDILHAEIVIYLGRISQAELTEKQTVELMHLMDAANDLENIGDVVEMNLVELGRRLPDAG